MNKQKLDFRADVVKAFLESLEKDGLNWKKQWNSGIFENAFSGYKYKGINLLYLYFNSTIKNYSDTRFATFNQIRKAGLSLKKGAKGIKVEYWFPFDKTIKKCVNWEDYRKADDKSAYLIVPKYHTVFNGDDIIGLPKITKDNAKNFKSIDIIYKLADGMNVPIYYDQLNKAFYSPYLDEVHLPEFELFTSEEGFVATAMHELSHATGHSTRLNRELDANFGSKKYAFEELVAEISSVFLMKNFNDNFEKIEFDNHAAYVKNWIEGLKEDPNIFFKAVKDAEKACNYIEYKSGIIDAKTYEKNNYEPASYLDIKENEIKKENSLPNKKQKKKRIKI